MKRREEQAALPLRSRTPDSWAETALADPIALLNDHAHLEKKAAANALELLTRWPECDPPENWSSTLTAIARDEAEHLASVTRLLYRRGGWLSKHHANPYAATLRRSVAKGGRWELADRLMVSALIEARSCERFDALARNCRESTLTKLYRGLWASEHGHFLVFLQLAESVQPAAALRARWEQWLDTEAETLSSQTPGPRVHSGS